MTVDYCGLPVGWSVTRVDRIATVQARIGWKALTAAEYQQDGYAFLATPNIKHENIDFENVNFISKFRFDESPELKLAIGDVLLAKDGTLGITNVIRSLPRPATVNGSIAVIRPTEMESRFLRYVLSSNPVQEHIAAVKDGIGVPHLFQRDIKRIDLPSPPIAQQRRIADFLDAETIRIDRLSALRAEQVKLLDIHEQTFVSTAVSRLAETWGEVRLRHLMYGMEQGWSPQCEDRLAEAGEWGVVKAGCVNGGRFRQDQHKALPADTTPRIEYQLKPGDLLMSRASGSSDLIGSVAIVPSTVGKLLLCDKIYRIHIDRRRVRADYLALVLRTHRNREHIKLGISGAEGMANNLPSTVIKDCLVPPAPLNIQDETVAEVERGLSDLAKVRQLAARQVSILAERRQALITAAVTGQFDVSAQREVGLP
jgi:type I restriction enzyme S subunit